MGAVRRQDRAHLRTRIGAGGMDYKGYNIAVHELGHTFTLRHCPDRTCIMHYCRNEEDVDRKSDELCRYCKVMLEDEIKRLKKSDGI